MSSPETSDASRRERLLILTAGVGAGHNSAAAAVRGAAAQRPDITDVHVLDVLDTSSTLYRDVVSKGYFALAAGLPWVVEWGYAISDPPFRRRGPVDPWTRANVLPAIREINRFRPTAIVNTHFLPAQFVASLVRRGQLCARTATVTTDFDFQGLWMTGAFHLMSVAREEAQLQLQSYGLPADRIEVTGIPIQSHPAGIATPAPQPPLVLISAGAAGGSYALAIVRQAMRIPAPFRAVVVCGKNATLRADVERLVHDHGDRFTVLGFTDAMPALMNEASLFVGKPGGLSASECMAAGLPMVMVDPIPGQEQRNGDYLLEAGAAVRCNIAATIGAKIGALLADPERLQRMSENARAIGRPDAASAVLAGLMRQPPEPLIVTRLAQKTILTADEQNLSAFDLTGPSALAHLKDTATGATVAVIRVSELTGLRRAFGTPDGDLAVSRRSDSRLGWETGQLVRRMLRGAGAVNLRAELVRR